MRSSEDQLVESAIYRIVTGAFGVLFVALAITAYVVSDQTLGAAVAAFVLGGLGLDAIVNAFRARKSLLARIGPLP